MADNDKQEPLVSIDIGSNSWTTRIDEERAAKLFKEGIHKLNEQNKGNWR